jgi:GDP-4-dehydro-6-deoxy-D-mannose reductase
VKRVLVTGASGFVGSHLCHYLAPYQLSVLGTYHRSKPKQSSCRLISLDLSSRAAVNKLIAGYKPDFVYHLAAQSISSGSQLMERETLQANTLGTVYLLGALRRFAPKTRFLLASSSHSYGKTFERKAIVSEKDLIWPDNPYAVSKVLAEMACRDFAARFSLGTIVARSFNHIGTGQRRNLVFSDWCRQIALAEIGKQKPVLEVGNLEVERDFMHVDDVVRAYHLLMEKGKAGEVYNVSSRKLYKLTVYLDFLLRKTKLFMTVKKDLSKIRPDESKIIGGNSSKIQKLGWIPQRNAFDAIEELLEEWRKKVRSHG